MAEWLWRLTRKPKVRTAEVRIPRWTVWSLSVNLARVDQGHVRKSGSFGGLMVKHPRPLLEISLSDFRRVATLNKITYLPIIFKAKVNEGPQHSGKQKYVALLVYDLETG